MVLAEVKYNSQAYHYGNKKIMAKFKSPILLKKIGASGSWAEPYFLAPRLSLEGSKVYSGYTLNGLSTRRTVKRYTGRYTKRKQTDLLENI